MLPEWIEQQLVGAASRRDLIKEDELREQSRRFLGALRSSLANGGAEMDVSSPAWSEMRAMLTELSRSRARQGFTASETATFVFSLKQPLFDRLRQELDADPRRWPQEIWTVSLLLDKLGLYTTEVYQKSREEVIARQQQEMLELSTPVVKLWDGILALPLIGTLDSARTQVVMEILLQKIVETGAAIAIIDITGVPTVDTLVAQHLLKTVAAARLMGADASSAASVRRSPRPSCTSASTSSDVITKATLADAFAIALGATGPHGRQAVGASGLSGGSMERIPILKMGDCLLVTIQVDMHDRLAMPLQDDLTEPHRARRVRAAC